MNYNHPQRNGSTIIIRMMCAIVFCCFSFLYLYFFQADVLMEAQHALSHGMTNYNPLTGAIVVTIALQLLQLLVYAVLRHKKRGHALTYLPSMLILAFMTDINSDIDRHFEFGAWIWIFPLVIVLWLMASFVVHGLSNMIADSEPKGLFSRAMWFNMLTMALMILGVVSVGNTNAVFHYRMRAESCLQKGDYAGALQPGWESLESDADLLMIRMYALSRTGNLGEKLFNFPISGTSAEMLPVEGKSHFALYPVDSLYKYLGARPRGEMTNYRYLELLQRRDTVDHRMIADYQLCGLLIDKKLDDFVRQLKQAYSLSDTVHIDALPRHYREALTLYTHRRANPQIVYHDSVMDEDWKNLQELESQYADKTERKGRVEERYRGTYWYYYDYE